MHKLKKIFLKIIYFLFNITRPFLGPKNVCIYHEACPNYAKRQLETRSIFIALPLITLRVLSCNPLTVLYWKIKSKFIKHNI